MPTDFKQEEYYDIDAIKARLRSVLGSDQWENIKDTDLGESLIALAANTIHQDAMAFFGGLDQMFKSTATLSGYLEEIAKSNGVIPETFVSSSVTVTLYSTGSAKSYAPMDFSFNFAGTIFYNIVDITIGDISNPTTVVLYEGSVIRQASAVGTSPGRLWSYEQLQSPVAVRVGEKVVRYYQVLPKNVFAESIMVETTQSYAIPFTRWQKVVSWYNQTPTSKAWVLDKDYIGRYRAEFGDGVYGLQYPTEDVVGIRYILSGGEGIIVNDLSTYKINYQDVNDITALFIVTKVGQVVDGQSEVNLDDLNLQIEAAQNSRNAIIDELDHKAYLDGRADVNASAVVFERKANPPNIEYFNTVRYAIKSNTEGGSFNDASIQIDLAENGIQTTEYALTDALYRKFNIGVLFSVLTGFDNSVVQSQIESKLQEEFQWSALGFDENITQSRIYDLLRDIEGLDISSLLITIESVQLDNDITGIVPFDFTNGEVQQLDFVPRRYRMKLTFDELVAGVIARDNSDGEIWGDLDGIGNFSNASTAIQRSSVVVNNMLFMGGVPSTSLRLLDMRKSTGGLSTVILENAVWGLAWVDRYSELASIEVTGPNWYIRTYEFPEEFFDPTSFSYLQLTGSFSPSKDKELLITIPAGFNSVLGFVYHDSYLYLLLNNNTTGNHRLIRHRITADQIDTQDLTYNSTGYLDLGAVSKSYRNMVVQPAAFGTDENVIFIASNGQGTPDDESGIDAIRKFDISDECFFEDDFFALTFPEPTYTLPIDWNGLTTDGTNLYGIRVDGANTIITRIYQIQSDGSALIKNISDISKQNYHMVAYNNFAGSIKIHLYDDSDKKVYTIDWDTTDDVPAERAGDGTTGSVNSLTLTANVNYALKRISYVDGGTNAELSYQSEEELIYENFQMAVLSNSDVANR